MKGELSSSAAFVLNETTIAGLRLVIAGLDSFTIVSHRESIVISCINDKPR